MRLSAKTVCCAFAFALSLALVAAGLARAQEAPLEQWLARLASADAATRKQAWEEAPQYGAAAVLPLGRLLRSEDPAVARAARLALEAIVASATRPGAEEERAATSRALAKLILGKASRTVRAMEIRLLALVGREEAVPALAQLLRDPELREDARQALERIPCAAAERALLDALPSASAEFKCALIYALAARRANDAVPALLQAARSAELGVRLAALRALGEIGDLRAAELLASAASQASGEEQRVAADAYLRLADAMLAAGETDRARRAYELVLCATPSPSQRIAALRGLEEIADPQSLQAIVRSLEVADPLFLRLAMGLVDKLAGKEATGLLLQAAKRAQPEARAAILLALAGRGAREVVPALLAALEGPEDVVKIAAARGLGMLAAQEAEERLLALAEGASGPVREAALASYLALLEKQREEKKRAADLVAKYNRALELATRDEERIIALRALAEFADPSSLALVEPLVLREPPLPEALEAYAKIGLALAGEKPEGAKRVLLAALRRGVSRGLASQCASALRKLGVKRDFAREAGFVTEWYLVGPFSSKNRSGFAKRFPPEQGVDVRAEVNFDGRVLRWRKHRTNDVQGIINFRSLFTEKQNVVVYAYAEVVVPREQSVLLKIGSDDSVKCWVNGKLVHEHEVTRPVRVDDDVVSAKLAAGKNELLVKVVQERGQWGFCLRITDPQGNPVAFTQPATE